MSLINETSTYVFDTESISVGDLIYIEYEYWNSPINGIIMAVSETKLVVIYYPSIANVTNRLELKAEDVVGGGYTIRWSSDLETITEYTSPEESEDDS